MTKEWFINIIKSYPKAYYRCLYHFKDCYPKEWKELMRDPDQLLDFFAAKRITIRVEEETCQPLAKQRFRFCIEGKYNLESAFIFEKHLHAKWAGIEFAFMVFNFQIRQSEKWKPPKVPVPERRRK